MYTKNEIRKVLLDRLEREIQKHVDRELCYTGWGIAFMQGYFTAISDSMWDLFYEVFIDEKWNTYMEDLKFYGMMKYEKVSIDKIDLEDNDEGIPHD
jgi:hypothetical protein